LIFRCQICAQTWNYPIVERRPVKEFAVGELQSFISNDTALAEHWAKVASRTHASHESPGCNRLPEIIKTITSSCSGSAAHLIIEIDVVGSSGLRLDRVLALGLGVSRAQIVSWHKLLVLQTLPQKPAALRRKLVKGQRVTFDHCVAADRNIDTSAIVLRACGEIDR
jgi:hypothetical protein